MKRCYNTSEKDISYKGCTVDSRWHNFQNFAKWFEDNYIEDWFLDKDILVPGNKIYGPDTCCFVPHLINSQFKNIAKKSNRLGTGVFKRGSKYQAKTCVRGSYVNFGIFDTAEEAEIEVKVNRLKLIKDLANEYKDKLNDNVYKILMNYEYSN